MHSSHAESDWSSSNSINFDEEPYLNMDHDHNSLCGILLHHTLYCCNPFHHGQRALPANFFFCSGFTTVPYPTADGAPLGEEQCLMSCAVGVGRSTDLHGTLVIL